MKLHVLNQKKNPVAILIFGPNGEAAFEGDRDASFEAFVAESIRNGITRLRHIHDKADGSSAIVEEPVSPEDPNFPLAFRDFLIRRGYLIEEEHPETLVEIRRLLELIPADNPLREKLLAQAPAMTYLEQTTALEMLREIAARKKGE